MPITDAFTGTNGTGLPTYSANWVYVYGNTDHIQIQGNAFSIAAGDPSFCSRTEANFPSDHYAQVTLTVPSPSYFLGSAVRCQAADSSQCYTYISDDVNSGIYEVSTAGSLTILGADASGFAANDVLRLTVSGTTLTPNKNGSTSDTPGAQTDATYSSGKPGVGGINSSGSGTVGRADSFECSDSSIPAVANQFSGTAPLTMFSSDTPTRFNV